MKYLLTAFLVLILIRGSAQDPYRLRIVVSQGEQHLQYKKHFPDTTARYREIAEVVRYFISKAYLEASCDSLGGDSLNRIAYIHRGPLYTTDHISLSGDSSGKLRDMGVRVRNYHGAKFTRDLRDNVCNEAVVKLENNGYPFASAALSNVTITEGKVNAQLTVNPGAYIVIDSLVRKGNAKISRNFMYRYLGIKSGRPYDETAIRRIDGRLRDLPFINPIKNTEIAFYEDKARIYLFIDKKKASNFSGIIGVLPNSAVPGKVLINGDVKLKLLNAFGQAELIDLNWRSLEKATQDLKVKLNYPYLLSTPFGIDYEFYLYKKDTSYLTLQHNIGLRYLMGGNDYLQVFTEIFSSSVIRAAGLETATVLPSYADVRRNMFGLEYFSEKLDYRMNPRSGIRVRANASAGIKTIKKNDNINPVLYDSLDLKTTQIHATLKFEGFIPLFRKQTLLMGFNGSYINNDQLFENELFRLGGISSLRGFDEESLRASAFGILLVEYRYLFEKNSFLSLFWNGAWVERKLRKEYFSDLPYGLGAGISFDTRAGIFSLYYALGSQQHGPLSFKQSKIHFGISTFF
jgi:outer membrane protein assembly factor BamA